MFNLVALAALALVPAVVVGQGVGVTEPAANATLRAGRPATIVLDVSHPYGAAPVR